MTLIMCKDKDVQVQSGHSHLYDNTDVTFYNATTVNPIYSQGNGLERLHLASVDVLGDGELFFEKSMSDTLYVEVSYSYEWLSDSIFEFVEGVLRLPLRVTPDFLHRTINFENIAPIPFPEVVYDSIDVSFSSEY